MKETIKEQHNQYLERKREIEVEWAVEEGRALPTAAEGAQQSYQQEVEGTGEIIPDVDPESDPELEQHEERESDKQMSTGDEEEEEEKPKRPKLPEYIAPALLIAAGIEAINKMFQQLLVPLAVVAFFRNELAKALVGVLGREALKKEKK